VTDKSAIHEAVESYWGERCPDHDPDCPTCKAWREYDAMMDNNTTDEETGKWVIVDYFPNSPTQVYGFFDSEVEARAYADAQGFGRNSGAYDIHMVLNAHLQVRREAWE
jgi:hypothetical protein